MGIDFKEFGAIYREAAEKHGRKAASQRAYDTADRLIKEKKASWKDYDFHDAFRALVPQGNRILESLQSNSRRSRDRFQRIMENVGGPVGVSAFTNISAPFFTSRVMADYQREEFVWPRLVMKVPETEVNVTTRHGRIGNIGNQFSGTIKEGDTYPRVGVTEEYTLHPPLQKRGGILEITREIMMSRTTGTFDLMGKCGFIGREAGIQTERQTLTTVLGRTGTQQYRYMENAAQDPYQTTGLYDNTLTGTPLVNYRSLEQAMLKQKAMRDPVTQEPIMMRAKQLIVPPALEMTALRIKNATSIEHVDNTAGADTIRTQSGNPLSGTSFDVVCNEYIKIISGNDVDWWWGDFASANLRRVAWELEVTRRADMGEAMFERDIFAAWKVSGMEITSPEEPRYEVFSDV